MGSKNLKISKRERELKDKIYLRRLFLWKICFCHGKSLKKGKLKKQMFANSLIIWEIISKTYI
jgi:hypothetical protein